MDCNVHTTTYWLFSRQNVWHPIKKFWKLWVSPRENDVILDIYTVCAIANTTSLSLAASFSSMLNPVWRLTWRSSIEYQILSGFQILSFHSDLEKETVALIPAVRRLSACLVVQIIVIWRSALVHPAHIRASRDRSHPRWQEASPWKLVEGFDVASPPS